MFKDKLLLCTIVLAIVFLLAGCHREKEAVLLRYTPQKGSTYPSILALPQTAAFFTRLTRFAFARNGR